MGGTCSIYGGEDKHVYGSSGGKLDETDHVEDLGVDGN